MYLVHDPQCIEILPKLAASQSSVQWASVVVWSCVVFSLQLSPFSGLGVSFSAQPAGHLWCFKTNTNTTFARMHTSVTSNFLSNTVRIIKAAWRNSKGFEMITQCSVSENCEVHFDPLSLIWGNIHKMQSTDCSHSNKAPHFVLLRCWMGEWSKAGN